jgi:hypothetical protein
MGKGGGGSPQPTSTTAYQTNLPEYAKPYVMNMLGAAQNQLFNTDGDQITGFKPYTPYSTDPTKYFAGPSSLQQSTYNEASRMQTPGQFGAATGLAGASGMGQLGTTGQAGMYGQQGSMFGGLGTTLGAAGAMQAMPAFGAGQQFAQQVTDPRSMQSFMSPYQQAVTDVAKAAAVREAQIAGQQANLGAARQGTYGGARQALASAERERGLLSNLSAIQAQGSQAAFDKAMQAQQFGANLGLQGIQTGLQGVQQGLAGTAQGMQGAGLGLQGVGAQQAGFAGAGQAASTLGNLSGAQQQADLARMGFQNQLGQQQQQYQQSIINQAIQDYATQQQYPYMQLSTMSNLLRGLPMQSMSTQQYQAQPSALQQGIGLLGTGASLYGAMRREGGTIKEYAEGGSVGLGYANRGVVDSMRDRLEEMFEQNEGKAAEYVAKSTSPRVKEIARELGIGAAPTGSLGRNMAGGGIIAFERGGDVEEEMSELDKIRANNEAIKSAAGKFFDLSNYDPLQQGYRAYKQFVYDPITRAVNKSPEEQAVGFRKASDAREGKRSMFSSTKEEQQKDDRDIAAAKVEADVRKKTEAAKAKQQAGFKFDPSAVDREDAAIGAALKATQLNQNAPPPGSGVPPAAPSTGTQTNKLTGIAAQLAEQDRLLAERGVTPGMGAETRSLMDYIKEGKERRMSEAGQDRYLRMAEAFARFGSTAGPMLGVASESLGGFAKGEAAARKELRAAELNDKKIASDIEKGQRAEARGDYAAAQKAFDSAADRESRKEIANRPGEFEKMYAKFAEGEIAAGRKPSFESFRRAYSGTDEDLVRLTKADAAVKILREDLSPGGYMQLAASKKPEDRQKAAEMLAAVYRRYGVDPTTGAVAGTQTAGGGGGSTLRFDASGKQIS